MASYKLFLLPGDGIGPEVTGEVERIIDWLNKEGKLRVSRSSDGLVGGCAYDTHGKAISEDDMARAQAADAVIFGAVGGPKWDKVPYEVRPEAGLLRLRKDLGLFANLRPAICYPALADASSLKRDVVEGLDILIVRELTGGVYFGEPKTITDLGNGQKRGIDTQVYDTYEIDRISRVAFDLARTRRNKVSSVEKRNVMKTGVLWNEVVTAHPQGEIPRCQARPCAGRQWRHAAGALAEAVRRHRHRQSLRRHAVRCRRHADRFARHAAVGLARRARRQDQRRKALYEPVHGSAPDIAGKGIANPIAMIASLRAWPALFLRHGRGSRPAGRGHRIRARLRPAHQGHHVGRHDRDRHGGDGRHHHRAFPDVADLQVAGVGGTMYGCGTFTPAGIGPHLFSRFCEGIRVITRMIRPPIVKNDSTKNSR